MIASCSACNASAVWVTSSGLNRDWCFTINFSVTARSCSPSVLASTRALSTISAAAFSILSCNIFSTWSSVKSRAGLTSIICSTPLRNSLAFTTNMPSAFNKNWMSTLGRPAGIPGIPLRLNSANLRLSFTKSRSPWYTEIRILDCPSTCVVYCLPTCVGTFELRGTSTSIRPPMVSIPRLKGVISSSKKSLLLPVSISAWTAAPSATTSSGLILSLTGFPKKAATASLTAGIRVLPPTITMASI